MVLKPCRASRAWLLALLFACEGPAGPQGEEGPIGPAGPAGENGAEGEAGDDGEDGMNGMSAVDSGQGRDAGRDSSAASSPDSGQTSVRSDCKWCSPVAGTRSCSPDGKVLQRCVSDGDGCGHWESMQTCAGKCVYRYGSEKDGLGNVELGGSACVAPGTLDCGVGLGACVYPETCNVGTGKCEPAAGQGMATATLTTAFDGITHQFTCSSYAAILYRMRRFAYEFRCED
jgi:hypothetical protein